MIHNWIRALTLLKEYTNDPIILALARQWLLMNRIYSEPFERYGWEIRRHIRLKVKDERMSTGSIKRTYIFKAGLIHKTELRLSEVIYRRKRNG